MVTTHDSTVQADLSPVLLLSPFVTHCACDWSVKLGSWSRDCTIHGGCGLLFL